MDIEKAGGLKKGVDEKPEKGFEEFMEQLDQDKEMRTKVNLFKDLEAVEEKKKLKLLKRTENKKEKQNLNREKVKLKKDFYELKNEQNKKNEDAQDMGDNDDWEDEDGIRLNELINDLKLDEEEDVPDLIN